MDPPRQGIVRRGEPAPPLRHVLERRALGPHGLTASDCLKHMGSCETDSGERLRLRTGGLVVPPCVDEHDAWLAGQAQISSGSLSHVNSSSGIHAGGGSPGWRLLTGSRVQTARTAAVGAGPGRRGANDFLIGIGALAPTRADALHPRPRLLPRSFPLAQSFCRRRGSKMWHQSMGEEKPSSGRPWEAPQSPTWLKCSLRVVPEVGCAMTQLAPVLVALWH